MATYYFYDRRPEELPDIPLGTDYQAALRQWREIHERKPLIAGTILEGIEAFEREEALPKTQEGLF